MPLKGLGLMTLVKLKFVNSDYPAVIVGTFEALTAVYGGAEVQRSSPSQDEADLFRTGLKDFLSSCNEC